VRALVIEHFQKQEDPLALQSLVLFLFSFYLRENCLGPSVYT
jgi:hypothetical protein